MIDPADTALPREPWVKYKPEARLSIVVDRMLNRCLQRPCYFTALHDADDGGRNDNQRARDENKGVKSGQLDFDVWQVRPFVARKLELSGHG